MVMMSMMQRHSKANNNNNATKNSSLDPQQEQQQLQQQQSQQQQQSDSTATDAAGTSTATSSGTMNGSGVGSGGEISTTTEKQTNTSCYYYYNNNKTEPNYSTDEEDANPPFKLGASPLTTYSHNNHNNGPRLANSQEHYSQIDLTQEQQHHKHQQQHYLKANTHSPAPNNSKKSQVLSNKSSTFKPTSAGGTSANSAVPRRSSGTVPTATSTTAPLNNNNSNNPNSSSSNSSNTAPTTAATTTTTTTNCATARKCVNMCEAYGLVCPWAAVVAARTTKKTIQELFLHSKLFHAQNPPVFRQIRAQELRLGEKLGEGGFSIVSKCTLLTTTSRRTSSVGSSTDGGDERSSEDTSSSNHHQQQQQQGGSEDPLQQPPQDQDPSNNSHSHGSATNNNSTNESKQELAIKYLRRRAMVDYHHFKHGAADLAVEAYFLQTLNHPNIIQLHGIAAGSIEANILSRNCGVGGCFLILDRLVETLEQRIEGWKKKQQQQQQQPPIQTTQPTPPGHTTATTTTTTASTATNSNPANSANNNTSAGHSNGALTPQRGGGNQGASEATAPATTTTTTTTTTTSSTNVGTVATAGGIGIVGELTNRSFCSSSSTTITSRRQSYLSSWSRSFMAGMVRAASGSGTASPNSSNSSTGGGAGSLLWSAATLGRRRSGAGAAAFVVLTTRYHRKREWRHSKRLQLLERLEIALQVAQAMEYLHSLSVMFRDLKPSNIGFNAEGTLKLFDFGLAKEIKGPPGSYRLTGHTGSRRYMAPEVAKGSSDYDLSVDVYGFGIMLWELCCAQKPFYGYSSNKHTQLVVMGGERPKMEHSHTRYWPNELQTLMKNCWSAVPAQRPPFSQIVTILQQIIDTTKDEIMAYTQQQQQYSSHNNSGGSSTNSQGDGDEKSLASMSEDAATLAVAAAAASAAGDAASVPQAPPSSQEDDGDDNGEHDYDDGNEDDLSMIRPRRYYFLPRISFFQRTPSVSSPNSRGRSATRSDSRKRGTSWGSWARGRDRSRSTDTANSDQRRRPQRRQSGGGILRSYSTSSELDAAAAARASAAANSQFVPPALISGASVIQVLTAAGAAAEHTPSSSSRLSQSFLRGRDGQPRDSLSSRDSNDENNKRRQALTSQLAMMSKDSEASVGKEHETTATTATTASSSGDDVMDLTFHSAVMDFSVGDLGNESNRQHNDAADSAVDKMTDHHNEATAKTFPPTVPEHSGEQMSHASEASSNEPAPVLARINHYLQANLLLLVMMGVTLLQVLLVFYQLGWLHYFVSTRVIPEKRLPAFGEF